MLDKKTLSGLKNILSQKQKKGKH